MNQEKVKNIIKCDFAGCNNHAEYGFSKNGESPFNICQNCAKELGEELKKIFVPLSPEPPFKNLKKTRRN